LINKDPNKQVRFDATLGRMDFSDAENSLSDDEMDDYVPKDQKASHSNQQPLLTVPIKSPA